MNNRLRRVGAIILVIIMVVLIIWMVYCGMTGSPNFMGAVFAAILFPVLVYVYLLIYRVLRGRNEDKKAREEEAQTGKMQAKNAQANGPQAKDTRANGARTKGAQKESAKSAGKKRK